MKSSPTTRSRWENDALAIWQAGVSAVDPFQLVDDAIGQDAKNLRIGTQRESLDSIGRICIIGGGKAVDGMAAAAHSAVAGLPIPVDVFVNAMDHENEYAQRLPAGSRQVVREAGCNEPTAVAVRRTEEMLEHVRGLAANDLCICLLSGGGSAMLCAPAAGVTLAEKLAVIRRLSAQGAAIGELNAVRRCLSRVKGGGLAAHCNAGRIYTLLISDVLGDDLRTIASGPTRIGSQDFRAAQETLRQYSDESWQPPASIQKHLQSAANRSTSQQTSANPSVIHHLILANLQTAMSGAQSKAQQLGYRVRLQDIATDQPDANQVGRELGQSLFSIGAGECVISGGEPTVALADETVRGKGGRNQQVALMALKQISASKAGELRPFAIVSGGTDGEDGPTDAAGAIFGNQLARESQQDIAQIDEDLATNNAYHFLESHNALLKTGPTGTNVCDLRVMLRGKA